MSPNGFAPCPAFEPGHSPRFTALLAALHVAALVAIVVAQLPFVAQCVLAAATAVSARRTIDAHALRCAPSSVVKIALRADGGWVLQRRDGRVISGSLHADSFIHPTLVVIGVQDGWRATFVPIPADALPPDDHRRLRVLVKWLPAAGVRV